MSYAISANRLTDGIVVFLSPNGWAESIGDAQRFLDKAAVEAALETRAKPDAAHNLIVEPTVFDLTEVNGVVRAAHIRESIRANGPTIRPDLGKQAGQ